MNLEGVALAELVTTLTVYCPGMDPAKRARKSFHLVASLDGAAEITLGDLDVTVSTLVLTVRGTDSTAAALSSAGAGLDAASWVPLADLSAVDIEGTVVARVDAGFSPSGGKPLGVGMSAGLVAALSRAAATGDVVTSHNLTVVATLDYGEPEGPLQVHLQAELADPCPGPRGMTLAGSLAVQTPEIALSAAAAGVYYCHEGRQFEWTVAVVVPSANVMQTVTLKNVEVSLWVTPAQPTREYSGSFQGTISLSDLVGKIPSLSANAADVTAAVKFTFSDEVKSFSLVEPVSVVIDVEVEFGGHGIGLVTGKAAFTLPCERVIAAVHVDIKEPMPEIFGSGTLVSSCGSELPDFELRVTMETLSLGAGVSLRDVDVRINGSKCSSESPWRFQGVVEGGGSAGVNGELEFSGSVSFGNYDEGGSNDCVSPPPPLPPPSPPSPPSPPPHSPAKPPTTPPLSPPPSPPPLPSPLSPPPSSPPTPPPPSPPPPPPSPPPAACTPAEMFPGCKCGSKGYGHGLPDNPFASSGLCCHKATKTVVRGAQATSWTYCADDVPGPHQHEQEDSAEMGLFGLSDASVSSSRASTTGSAAPTLRRRRRLQESAIEDSYRSGLWAKAFIEGRFDDGNINLYVFGSVNVGGGVGHLFIHVSYSFMIDLLDLRRLRTKAPTWFTR